MDMVTENIARVATEGVPGRAGLIRLTMPMPPSLNNAYVNSRRNGGRVLSQSARDWKSHALWHLKAQRLPIMSGPLIVIYGFERSAAMARADADNRVKLAQDSLVAAGVMADDHRVVASAFSWMPAANGLCHCIVMPAQRITLEFQPTFDGACGAWILTAPQSLMEHFNGD